MASKASTADTLERKIYFYRVYAGLDDSRRRRVHNFTPAFHQLAGIPFDQGGRYTRDAEGKRTCCWVERQSAPSRVRLATIRDKAFPLVEDGGKLDHLDIPASSGLAEVTHAVFFASGIVGCEFNFYGPRLPSIATLLDTQVGPLPADLTFELLLRGDEAEQLKRLEGLSMLRLRVRESYAAEVAKADASIGAALTSLAEAGETDSVEVVMYTKPRSRASLGARALQGIKAILNMKDIRDNAQTFKVRGRPAPEEDARGHSVLIDLLNDKLVATKRPARVGPRSRAVEPNSMFEAIEEAYAELLDQLETAAGVSP